MSNNRIVQNNCKKLFLCNIYSSFLPYVFLTDLSDLTDLKVDFYSLLLFVY